MTTMYHGNLRPTDCVEAWRVKTGKRVTIVIIALTIAVMLSARVFRLGEYKGQAEIYFIAPRRKLHLTLSQWPSRWLEVTYSPIVLVNHSQQEILVEPHAVYYIPRADLCGWHVYTYGMAIMDGSGASGRSIRVASGASIRVSTPMMVTGNTPYLVAWRYRMAGVSGEFVIYNRDPTAPSAGLALAVLVEPTEPFNVVFHNTGKNSVNVPNRCQCLLPCLGGQEPVRLEQQTEEGTWKVLPVGAGACQSTILRGEDPFLEVPPGGTLRVDWRSAYPDEILSPGVYRWVFPSGCGVVFSLPFEYPPPKCP